LPARIRKTAKPEMKMKKARCKDGDLALVVHDIPECSDNIGRVVKVRGPLLFNRRYRKYCWLIEPVVQHLYAVERRGVVNKGIVLFCDSIEHPDDWLLPIGREPASLEETGRMVSPEGRVNEQRVPVVAFRGEA
jgi:hypothetical protein